MPNLFRKTEKPCANWREFRDMACREEKKAALEMGLSWTKKDEADCWCDSPESEKNWQLAFESYEAALEYQRNPYLFENASLIEKIKTVLGLK